MKYDFLTLSRPRSRALEDPKKETKKKIIMQNSQKMDFRLDGVFEDFDKIKISFVLYLICTLFFRRFFVEYL